jgi:molecular chaperone DnaK (HSP70)
MITSWDSVKYHCTDKEKTPSVISYDENGKLLWGYSVSDKKSAIEWFKLCLLEGDDIPNDIRNSAQLQAAQASLKAWNKSIVDIISDYLRALWKHSILNIRRAIGGQLVDLCRFKVVATLPAIWPAYAQARMYEAIEKAGILKARTAGGTSLEFLSEPEAAALATMKGMSMYNRVDMKVRVFYNGS